MASAADGLQQNNCARPDRSNRLRASGWATRSEECGAASSDRAKHQSQHQVTRRGAGGKHRSGNVNRKTIKRASL